MMVTVSVEAQCVTFLRGGNGGKKTIVSVEMHIYRLLMRTQFPGDQLTVKHMMKPCIQDNGRRIFTANESDQINFMGIESVQTFHFDYSCVLGWISLAMQNNFYACHSILSAITHKQLSNRVVHLRKIILD